MDFLGAQLCNEIYIQHRERKQINYQQQELKYRNIGQSSLIRRTPKICYYVVCNFR